MKFKLNSVAHQVIEDGEAHEELNKHIQKQRRRTIELIEELKRDIEEQAHVD